jgi:uncharacterized repeat protein (TIGR01451 family)
MGAQDLWAWRNQPGPTQDSWDAGTTIQQANSIYAENEVIPFRWTIEDGNPAPQLQEGVTYTIQIDYAFAGGTTDPDKFFFDYLTSYDATEPGVTDPFGPGSDLPDFQTGNLSQVAIPTDPDVAVQMAGVFDLFNIDPNSVVFGAYTEDPVNANQEDRQLTITFTPDDGDAIDGEFVNVGVAWGAHLASQVDYGFENGAANFPGASPQMVVDLDPSTSGDTTNLNINPNAIVPQGQITIIKDALPDDPQDFGFTITGPDGANITPNFTLDDDGDPNNGTSNQITFFGLAEGVYTITENVTSGWSVTGITGTENGAEDTTPDDLFTGDTGARTATVTVANGEVWTVEFTNEPTNPDYTITKTVTSITNPDLSDGGTTVDEAGDVINYTIEVENTGDQDLTGVTVDDPLLGGDLGTPDSGDNDNDGVLDVSETWVYNESYTVTQADIDANGIDANGDPDGDGDIDNTATVSSNELPNESADAVVPIGVTPLLSLIKDGVYTDADGNGEINPGDTLDYTFTVTNDGSVTITGVSINEVSFDLPGDITITPPADVDLSPGESAVFSGQVVLTQADIDAIDQQVDGDVDNIATAEGDDPNGDPVVSLPDDAEIPLDPQPGINIDKTATLTNDADGDGEVSLGDTITYTYTVTNTGNVTLDNLAVTDDILGPIDLGVEDDSNGDGVTVLAPDAVEVGTATAVVTQADVDAGEIVNLGTVTADDPNDDPVSDDDPETVPIDPRVVLSLIKDGVYTDADGNGEINPGDTLDYTFTVTNDGSVTITGVSINEVSFDLPGDITITPPADVDLSPGESAVFSGQVVLTQADIDAIDQQVDGDVDNIATAEGTDPNGDPVVSNPDDAEIPLDPQPGINIDKTATLTNDADGDGEVSLGDTITYTYTVTNTGNVTLDNLAVTDDILGPIDLGVEDDSNGDGVTVLAPDAVEVGTATAVVTQADVDAGEIVNLGTVTADDPNDDPVSDDDPETVPIDPRVVLSLIKDGVYTDADGNGEINPGDTLDPTFRTSI